MRLGINSIWCYLLCLPADLCTAKYGKIVNLLAQWYYMFFICFIATCYLNTNFAACNLSFCCRSKIENQQAEKAHQVRRAPSFSGPLTLPNRASANSKSAPINSSGGINTFPTSSLTKIVLTMFYRNSHAEAGFCFTLIVILLSLQD